LRFSWIVPGVLAAGSIPFSAKDIRSLHQQGIRAIVSLTIYPLTTSRDITSDLFNELDITYFHSPVQDNYPPDLVQARKIIQFIAQMETEGRTTYIHCHAGVGRTGTILHAYFLNQGLSLEEAREQVKSCRIQCILLSDEQKSFLKEFVDSLPGREL
jgi:atypical dual specificity phosphatase